VTGVADRRPADHEAHDDRGAAEPSAASGRPRQPTPAAPPNDAVVVPQPDPPRCRARPRRV